MADVNAVLQTLQTEVGKPYVWGATGPNTFDCSGLVQYVYGQNGIQLPRTAAEQAKVGQSVPIGSQQPGDLVFSNWEGGRAVTHVAVYVGNGEVIEAPEPGKNVEVSALNSGYLAHVSNIQRVNGVSGTATTSVAGGGLDPFAGVTSAINGIGQSFAGIGALATTLNKLALPQTWVRAFAGLVGTVLVFMGIWRLMAEVK